MEKPDYSDQAAYEASTPRGGVHGRADPRDAEIARLRAALATANANHERFERECYLRGDEIERLRAALKDTASRAHAALARTDPR